RRNGGHGIRLSKSEVGFRHVEGRSSVALLRHLTWCCVTLTFVAGRAAELRGENPEVTAEQVCRGLNWACAAWLARLRGTSQLQYTADVIGYHQQRNRAARESRQRRQRGLPAEDSRAESRRSRRAQTRTRHKRPR